MGNITNSNSNDEVADNSSIELDISGLEVLENLSLKICHTLF